jgi:hypothetical protein
MNENEKISEWIDRFNNHDLHGKELNEFLEMMKLNPELRREVKLDKELNEILADTDIIELRKKILKHKIPKESPHPGLHIFLLAASVTILIGLAILVYLWKRQGENEIRKTDYTHNPYDTSIILKDQLSGEEKLAHEIMTSDSTKSQKKKGNTKSNDKSLMADNYKPYPPYESMVGEVSRTTSFKLIKPSGNDTFRRGSVIAFNWETASSHSTTITITDNKGESCYVSRPIDGKKFLFDTSKLTGGLYYIKFICSDEIVCFAKFTLL